MRLVTRGDVDGMMCAALLKDAGLVDDLLLVHPKEMQDGVVAIGADDIVCNLPYAEASEVAALSTEQVLRARSLVLTEKAFAALNEA